MTTDSEGRYRLAIPGEGSYRLAVSHAGYEPVFENIEQGEKSVVMDVALQIRELDEVTVAKKIKFRSEDIDLFWTILLGEAPSKKYIYATNPQAPYFYYNTSTNILTVTCREPIKIINNETGYSVLYLLKNFTHNYNIALTSWEGEYALSAI